MKAVVDLVMHLMYTFLKYPEIFSSKKRFPTRDTCWYFCSYQKAAYLRTSSQAGRRHLVFIQKLRLNKQNNPWFWRLYGCSIDANLDKVEHLKLTVQNGLKCPNIYTFYMSDPSKHSLKLVYLVHINIFLTGWCFYLNDLQGVTNKFADDQLYSICNWH